MKKAIYLRVSKKELDEQTQLPIILKAFNLKEKDVIILHERKSGYLEDAQKNRTELKKLIELVNKGVISDIYVYSLERIYRNIDWLLKFYFDCRVMNVEIHSYLQPEIDKFDGSKPIDTFLKYQSVLVNGFMAQQESYLTSQRTTKSFVVDDDGIKRSYKGNKLGRKTDIDAKDIELIKKMAGQKLSYRRIKQYFKLKYDKDISLSHISNIVNRK